MLCVECTEETCAFARAGKCQNQRLAKRQVGRYPNLLHTHMLQSSTSCTCDRDIQLRVMEVTQLFLIHNVDWTRLGD